MSEETKAEIISWITFIAGALVCAFVINTFILFNAYIPSASMENTIMTGNRVLGLRLKYTFDSPERYDVAIFKYPDDEKQYYVKRVVGLPGEKLEIKKGKVYIDDSPTPLYDYFVKETPYEEDWGPYEIPEDSYFMMGDNRNYSKDSRWWENTYVKEDKILAKAYIRIWPNPGLVN